MTEIRLDGIEFFAYHGHHDEERVTGNKYSVDVSIITKDSESLKSDTLGDTIDYSSVYKIVKEEMAKPARLLEHLSHRINESILKSFPEVSKVKSAVSKFNPPLGGICKKATVITESAA